jgi:hypothetical protein
MERVVSEPDLFPLRERLCPANWRYLGCYRHSPLPKSHMWSARSVT